MANLKIIADYHTHTIFSHGKNTIEENVLAAIDKNLSEIAICDHGPSHIFYGIKRHKLNEYLDEIARVKKKYKDKIKVLSALELNVRSFNGFIDVDSETAKRFDILLLGYHKAVWCDSLDSFFYFTLMRRFNKKNVDKTTRAYIEAIKKNNIFLIVHPGYGMRLNYDMLIPYLKKYGTAVEINSSHNELSIEDIDAFTKAGIKLVISSDAHESSLVGNFDDAYKFAESAELSNYNILNANE
ncbi:MAG: PHP domain-containing protein [Eubacteriales bacterium]